MMRQAQQMQTRMAKIQEELAEARSRRPQAAAQSK